MKNFNYGKRKTNSYKPIKRNKMNGQAKKTIGISFMISAFILGIFSESKKGVEMNYFVSVSFVCFLIGIYLLINTKKK